MKKELQDKKAIERASTETASRGFSTDQRINIENMNINRQRLNHQHQETQLVGLSIHESAIGRQIASAEARAASRCAKYNPKNIYWKRVDDLLEKQDNVTDDMGNYTKSIREDNSKKDNDKGIEVSDFLNQPSPQKKGGKRTFESMKGDTSIIAIDDEEDEGLAVKLERIKDVTENGNVSRLLTRRGRRK